MSTTDLPTIGVYGAGKAGTALARLTVDAGHRTLVTGSPRSSDLALLLELTVPGAEATDALTLARRADLVALLVPFSRRVEPPFEKFDGKIVVDAMNYWPPVDGADPAVEADGRGTTEIVAENNPRARWVKSSPPRTAPSACEDARGSGHPLMWQARGPPSPSSASPTSSGSTP